MNEDQIVRISELREKNPGIRLSSVEDTEEFKTYGRIVTGYDFSDIVNYMEEKTDIPTEGNVYVASVPEMEEFPEAAKVQNLLYGGMEIEIGYCNGRNTTYNGFEFHKGSEINVAVTDFMLCLGHTWDIRENTYSVDEVHVFYVPSGTAIEMYQTTLHLSPCRTCDEGFKGVVILPRGTNTPLTRGTPVDEESRLLLQKNKWVIAHPEREPLMRQGAVGGVKGPNIELKY
jgi:hypothetical protein